MEYIGDSMLWEYTKGQSRIFEMPTEAMLVLFKARAMKKRDITANAFGLYSDIPIGRNGKARIGSISHPKHMFQKRTNCLTWNAKGKSHMQVESLDLQPIEAMMEQCPDTFMGDCLEYILGTGNDVRDMLATEEGRRLLAAMLDGIYLGMGNALVSIYDAAGHPLIEQSNTNDWFSKEEGGGHEWDDYYDQQMNINVKGHRTLIDEHPGGHMNIAIHNDEVRDDKFIGNIPDLLSRVKEGMRPELKKMVRNRMDVVTKVTPGIFEAIEDHITNQYGNIPEDYRYNITGVDGNRRPLNDVIQYKGMWYILDNEQEQFDILTGTHTHRVLTTVRGNLGIAYDTAALDMYEGVGLRVEQRLDLPYKGQIFMNTNLKVNAAILDHTLASNCSITLTP